MLKVWNCLVKNAGLMYGLMGKGARTLLKSVVVLHERQGDLLQAIIFAGSGLQVRPPMAPSHFFLIDVSYNAITTGATAAACSAVLRVLDEIQGRTWLGQSQNLLTIPWRYLII